MEKDILLIVNKKPVTYLKVEKSNTISDIKAILKDYLTSEFISISFLIDKKNEVPVFKSNDYDKINLESIWDKMVNPKIIISLSERQEKIPLYEDIQKLNQMINNHGTIDDESIVYLNDLADKMVRYFSLQLKESKQPITPGSIRNILFKKENNPFSKEFQKHARSEGDKMIGQVCIEKMEVRLLKLEKFNAGKYLNFDPNKSNCESGAFLTGIIQYIIEEIIDLASSNSKNITFDVIKEVIEDDDSFS